MILSKTRALECYDMLILGSKSNFMGNKFNFSEIRQISRITKFILNNRIIKKTTNTRYIKILFLRFYALTQDI